MGLNYVTPFCQVKTGALSPYGIRSVILMTEASEIFILAFTYERNCH